MQTLPVLDKRLSCQLNRTQDEPAFCGLATLAMVLNALSIDPGRSWKGPWRWFNENMLDCCKPLEKVKEEGIAFKQVGDTLPNHKTTAWFKVQRHQWCTHIPR